MGEGYLNLVFCSSCHILKKFIFNISNQLRELFESMAENMVPQYHCSVTVKIRRGEYNRDLDAVLPHGRKLY